MRKYIIAFCLFLLLPATASAATDPVVAVKDRWCNVTSTPTTTPAETSAWAARNRAASCRLVTTRQSTIDASVDAREKEYAKDLVNAKKDYEDAVERAADAKGSKSDKRVAKAKALSDYKAKQSFLKKIRDGIKALDTRHSSWIAAEVTATLQNLPGGRIEFRGDVCDEYFRPQQGLTRYEEWTTSETLVNWLNRASGACGTLWQTYTGYDEQQLGFVNARLSAERSALAKYQDASRKGLDIKSSQKRRAAQVEAKSDYASALSSATKTYQKKLVDLNADRTATNKDFVAKYPRNVS